MTNRSPAELDQYLEQEEGAPSAPILRESGTVRIERPASEVWALAGGFGQLGWFPAIKGVTVTDGNNLGSQRLIDFGGPKLLETLIAYDPVGRSYVYAIDETPDNRKRVPASGFKGRLSIDEDGDGGALATWDGVCRRADLEEAPAPGADDDAAVAHMQRTFKAGLAALKEAAEAA